VFWGVPGGELATIHTAVVVVRGLVEYVAAVIAASAAWTEFSTRTRNDDIHSGV
jgi:hypothetical protein